MYVFKEAELAPKFRLLFVDVLWVQTYQVSAIPGAVVIGLSGFSLSKPVVEMFVDDHRDFEMQVCSIFSNASSIGRSAHPTQGSPRQHFSAQNNSWLDLVQVSVECVDLNAFNFMA